MENIVQVRADFTFSNEHRVGNLMDRRGSYTGMSGVYEVLLGISGTAVGENKEVLTIDLAFEPMKTAVNVPQMHATGCNATT